LGHNGAHKRAASTLVHKLVPTMGHIAHKCEPRAPARDLVATYGRARKRGTSALVQLVATMGHKEMHKRETGALACELAACARL